MQVRVRGRRRRQQARMKVRLCGRRQRRSSQQRGTLGRPHLAAEARRVQPRRHGRRVGTVGRGQPLGVDVCLAVGGRVTLLGHSKVDKHLRAAGAQWWGWMGVGGQDVAAANGNRHSRRWGSPGPSCTPQQSAANADTYLGSLPKPPLVQPGLQHAVLNPDKVCRRGGRSISCFAQRPCWCPGGLVQCCTLRESADIRTLESCPAPQRSAASH